MKTLNLNILSILITTTSILLSGSLNHMYAQTIPINNSGFENTSCVFLTSYFDQGCMGSEWLAASGRPSRSEEQYCTTPTINQASAFLAAGNRLNLQNQVTKYGSSLVYNFPDDLTPGDYTLSFCHEALFNLSPEIDLRIDLAKGITTVDINSFQGDFQNYEGQKPLNGITATTIVAGVAAIDDSWNTFEVDFTISCNQQCNQLWFYGIILEETIGLSELYLDNISLTKRTEVFNCIEYSNLTACTQEGYTGYVDLDCGEGATYDFEVPSWSTAESYDCHGHFILSNANPGSYTVTITNTNGCTEVRTYEVIEECCEEESCTTPQNLGCTNLFGQTYLKWDPVPDALQYQICIFKGRCGNTSSTPDIIKFSFTNQINLDEIDAESFEWSVKTVCQDETLSEPSPKVCFDSRTCDGFSGGLSMTVTENQSAPPCPIACEEAFNLIFCAEEGRTGYIDLTCTGQNSIILITPEPSTANAYSCGDHFLVTNASPGTYTLIITNSTSGCRDTLTYEVIEECCREIVCPTPQNLDCNNILGQTYLNWDAVPNVTQYRVCIFPGQCGTTGSIPSIIKSSNTNRINLNEIGVSSFEWSVKAICEGEVLSDPSAKVCFNPNECDGFSFPSTGSASDDRINIQQILISPNPSSGQFSIALPSNLENLKNAKVIIYNQLGARVFQNTISDLYTTVNLEDATSGIYFIHLFFDDQIFTEKLIIQ